jgi:light-regulated signal transduction histidine kinase (bacteriophytochrome)
LNPGVRRRGTGAILSRPVPQHGISPRIEGYQAIGTMPENANQTLERWAREQAQLRHILGHDLREPLRMVISFTELLARRYHGRLDAEADEFIAYAVNGARRLQDMLDDLAAYLRIDTDELQLQTTDCNALVSEVLRHLPAAAQAQEGTVNCAALPSVQADPRQLALVFHHLLDNAFKFRGAREPRIRIAARAQESGHLFTVSDNGIGLDPRSAERIFQLFQHLHAAEKNSGRGTGLALVRKIVERHGGRIWVESEPGRGSAFHFTVPSAQPRSDSPA